MTEFAVVYALGALGYHAVMSFVLGPEIWPGYAQSERGARQWYSFFLAIWPISIVWMLMSAIKAMK